MMPAATDALNEAPVDAVVRAANALGGVTPWSIDETRIASIKRATAGFGNSPVKTKYAAAPNETCPINSAISYPGFCMKQKLRRVTPAFKNELCCDSLMRLP